MSSFMPRLMICAAAMLGAFAPGLRADNPVVVELFTSQGCSSCPPADALLAALAERDDVIPLALHVDYWDYMGWKDRFADPAFTQRQKGYAHAGGWKMIYTPQVVVNGTDALVGSRGMELAETIRAHAAKPPHVALELRREGGRLLIRAEALKPGGAPCDLHVVRYAPRQSVDITRGENAGHRLTYTHIATNWHKADRWDGQGVFETALPDMEGPVVVLLQEPGHGAILAAARLR